MARVVEMTSETLEGRRQEVLSSIDVDEQELRRRAEAGTLSEQEWDAWEELRNIAFLLGDG